MKQDDNIDNSKRFIIFPYVKNKHGYTLIDENVFKSVYPLTYLCLSLQKDKLDSRDKGKRNPQGWYAYGRTQGLNKYGKKLLFPTFSNNPKFIFNVFCLLHCAVFKFFTILLGKNNNAIICTHRFENHIVSKV